MTIKEALNQYSTSYIESSFGDNVVSLCWRIYRSLDEHLQTVLMLTNIRYDWDNVKPGERIYYLSAQAAAQVEG